MPQSNRSKTKNIREWIFGRGFYVALTTCIVAAIVAIICAANIGSKSQPIDAPLATQPSTTTTTCPSTTTTTTRPSTSSTTAKPTEPVIDTQVPYSSYYLNPVGGKVTRFYSTELVFSETMDDYRAHSGVDFEAEVGETVYAINNGTVKAIYNDTLLGSVVEIDHAHDVIARYCAVETTLTVGDTVSLGQAVGTLATIPLEANEQSHLHLEISHNGAIVDPIDLMSKNGTEGEVKDEDVFVQYDPNAK